ncbi:MAG: hypothetical protein LBR20_06490 [Propionibacteriaceae bacterium]|jgi:hypothetical protein|nr:hypothetical protein [Propionibacteriaceae bacterium]
MDQIPEGIDPRDLPLMEQALEEQLEEIAAEGDLDAEAELLVDLDQVRKWAQQT